MSRARTAKVAAFAKINLDLRVLYRRADNYHELRTIFQTISLADRIDITFTPSRRTGISVTGHVEIPDNLMGRAAQLCFDAMRITGQVEIAFEKRIPIGAGLGGGSSDAAAVLLALPVLAGHAINMASMLRIAGELGSDVPFFLLGGTAAGIGRGTELYPLPDGRAREGVLVAPAVHVSTAEAYRLLSPELTSESQQNKMVSFQTGCWQDPGAPAGENDFERVVFRQHPELESIKRRLLKLGAKPARMSGSGSAVYGLFAGREEVQRAVQHFKEERVFPISLVSRARYRSEWWKWLRSYTSEKLWPPLSRSAR